MKTIIVFDDVQLSKKKLEIVEFRLDKKLDCFGAN